jgi:low temperature requirement protein LtrA
MALGLFMNAAIGVAFDELGWAFAVALVVTQITRGTITSVKAPTPPLRQHYRRALTWMLASAPPWLAEQPSHRAPDGGCGAQRPSSTSPGSGSPTRGRTPAW